MDRIQEFDNVVPQGGNIWAEVKIKKQASSLIIDPNKPLDIDYIVVKNVGQHVTDVEVEDIILEFIDGYVPKHSYKLGEKTYVQVPRNVCFTIVKGNNFKM